MKRWIGIFLVILCCAGFWGCEKKASQGQIHPSQVESQLTNPFESTAKISDQTIEATAKIVSEEPRSCTVSFTSPESLNGMSFIFLKDQLTVDYNGISFHLDPQNLPGGAVANMVVSALNAATEPQGVHVELKENCIEVTGLIESGEFLLKLDPQSGNFLKLSIPASELEVEFLNFCPL